nr:Na+/H+ antiporter NhaC family protein [Acidaminococcus timonensis]
MNFAIALPAALVSLVLYYLVSGQVVGSIQVGEYNFLQVLPYIFVLVLALRGINVALVLLGGILMTGIIGLSQGTVDIFTWARGLGSGMEDMFSISIVAILVSGIIALVRYYGGVEWMVQKITKHIHGRKGAEYGIGLLSGILSAAMVNNTIAIIVTCPIARVVGAKYSIAPKRLASLVDIFACSFLCVMPHDGGMLIVTQLAGTSPLDVMKYCYYIFALLIATCITIQFGTHENK